MVVLIRHVIWNSRFKEADMRTKALFRRVISIALVVAASSVSAGDADDQKVAARAQRMLRQISQERDSLQTENAKLKIEIEDLTKKLSGLKKSSEAALSKSRESNTSLNENLQQTMQSLRKTESVKNQLQDTVVGQAQQIESCEFNNAKLVQTNRELIDHYDKKGFFDALLQHEPLTQLKRVEIENITQEYQDRVDQLEFKRKTETTTR
jgi:septal ring factor EnvC (AmiA/AmiB activator)